MRLTQNFLKNLIETKVKKLLKEEEVSDDLEEVPEAEAKGPSLPTDAELDAPLTKFTSQGGIIPDPEPTDNAVEAPLKTTNPPVAKPKLSAKETKKAKDLVIQIQNNLITRGYTDISKTKKPDGLYGPLTVAAVKKFFKDHNLIIPNRGDFIKNLTNINNKIISINPVGAAAGGTKKTMRVPEIDLSAVADDAVKDAGARQKLMDKYTNPAYQEEPSVSQNQEEPMAGGDTEVQENKKFKMSYVEKIIKEETKKFLAEEKVKIKYYHRLSGVPYEAVVQIPQITKDMDNIDMYQAAAAWLDQKLEAAGQPIGTFQLRSAALASATPAQASVPAPAAPAQAQAPTAPAPTAPVAKAKAPATTVPASGGTSKADAAFGEMQSDTKAKNYFGIQGNISITGPNMALLQRAYNLAKAGKSIPQNAAQMIADMGGRTPQTPTTVAAPTAEIRESYIKRIIEEEYRKLKHKV